MENSGNELNVSSKNEFFANKDVPYCLKAGAAAVFLHATVDYYKNTQGQDVFMSMFFDKDTSKSGKANRVVSGTMSFTFGVPASMGEDNCQASIKKLVELYPAVGDVLDNISTGNLARSDADICRILSDASAKRFIHSQEGSVKNWEEYVSDNFDAFVKQAQSHYPGMVSVDVYENLKTMFENACKKKTIIQPQMA